uniref:Uncharacterized protein n=1 Tax=Echinococcus canadensis TaxID=519352 RepID=A0A915EX25_9CEST
MQPISTKVISQGQNYEGDFGNGLSTATDNLSNTEDYLNPAVLAALASVSHKSLQFSSKSIRPVVLATYEIAMRDMYFINGLRDYDCLPDVEDKEGGTQALQTYDSDLLLLVTGYTSINVAKLPIYLLPTQTEGLSLDVQASAATVIIHNSNWNPQLNLKPMDS